MESGVSAQAIARAPKQLSKLHLSLACQVHFTLARAVTSHRPHGALQVCQAFLLHGFRSVMQFSQYMLALLDFVHVTTDICAVQPPGLGAPLRAQRPAKLRYAGRPVCAYGGESTRRALLGGGLALLTCAPVFGPQGACAAGRLKSRASDVPCVLRLVNASGEWVKLYWLNYDGALLHQRIVHLPRT